MSNSSKKNAPPAEDAPSNTTCSQCTSCTCGAQHQQAWIQFASAALAGLTPSYRLKGVVGGALYYVAIEIAEQAAILACAMLEEMKKDAPK